MRKFTLLSLALQIIAAPICAHGQSQGQMNQQVASDLESENIRLKNIYNRLLSALEDSAKDKLSAAQKSWEVYRDLEADFEAEKTEGGSMRTGVLMATKLRLTQERTETLNKELSFIAEMDKIYNNKKNK